MLAKFKKLKKEDSIQSTVFSVLLGVLAVALIGFLIFSNVKINERRNRLTSQLEDLRGQVRELEEKKNNLEAGIFHQGSQEYLEEIARENLNLKEQGEQVVAFIEEKEEEGKEEKEQGIFNKIIEKIKFWQ
jgi:cell division protein FtsB